MFDADEYYPKEGGRVLSLTNLIDAFVSREATPFSSTFAFRK
jgi:hypothetical protein